MLLRKRYLSQRDITRIKRHLQNGGVIAYPTESCFGLGCLPTHPQGLKRVIRLKKRPQHKGMIVIGAGVGQLTPLLAPLSVDDRWCLTKAWPAAKTFLVPCSKHVLPLLRGASRQKLAVRVPDHDGARQLCLQLGTPLVSTSCNKAGFKPCKTTQDAMRQFGHQAWVIPGLIGFAKNPSQIIDLKTGTRLR
jgi:L-threonylcarbamoyladenylate synthase